MFERLLNKAMNRETVSYLIFGVLTTLVDWISYKAFRLAGMDYRLATICCQGTAILFAYITNKLWVFQSYNFHPKYLLKEMTSFFSCRILTAVFTYVAMVVMVDGMGIKQDMICKIIVSAISLVLNYVFSKLFIFKKKSSEGK
ncbi:GtrA family protein [Clostridium sp. AM58-1XD]|uniref:GtrA family protein n=1 Tax=Clostridium sp. AM58-1XD TaxID=2292307 RepID=UPI000E4C342B|nr:GtrA family protein [Clostridium sp. AM58-1XD]RGY99073.1 GtrA family protein [Clostridium sp. AM58-1XD]